MVDEPRRRSSTCRDARRGSDVPGCQLASRSIRERAQSLGAGSSVAIGTIVPNTGVICQRHHPGRQRHREGKLLEDVARVRTARRRGLRRDRHAAHRRPRQRRRLLRSACRETSIFGQIGNPPTGQGSTVVNSTLQQVAQGTTGVQPPPVMLIYDYDAKIGASTSVERRRADGAAVVVGARRLVCRHAQLQLGRVRLHLDAGRTTNPLDLNAPDIGAAYLPQNRIRRRRRAPFRARWRVADRSDASLPRSRRRSSLTSADFPHQLRLAADVVQPPVPQRLAGRA